MPDYIERKLAKQVLLAHEYSPAEYDLGEVIDSIPAADVVEVRHGKWVDDGEDWFCDRCNHNALCDKMTGIQVLSAVCPNCGSKMDGKGRVNDLFRYDVCRY